MRVQLVLFVCLELLLVGLIVWQDYKHTQIKTCLDDRQSCWDTSVETRGREMILDLELGLGMHYACTERMVECLRIAEGP